MEHNINDKKRKMHKKQAITYSQNFKTLQADVQIYLNKKFIAVSFASPEIGIKIPQYQNYD